MCSSKARELLDGHLDGLEYLQDKCGIFACIANGEWPTNLDVAHIICLGLVGLQHRGQESAGIVTCNWIHEPLSVHRGLGLVSQVFNDAIMMTLKGNLGIGHTRYSTMGGVDNVALVQPFMVHTSYGTIAVAHNGQLVNSNTLRQRILANGVGLLTGSDSELITQVLSMEPPEQFKQDYINRQFKNKSTPRTKLFSFDFSNISLLEMMCQMKNKKACIRPK